MHDEQFDFPMVWFVADRDPDRRCLHELIIACAGVYILQGVVHSSSSYTDNSKPSPSKLCTFAIVSCNLNLFAMDPEFVEAYAKVPPQETAPADGSNGKSPMDIMRDAINGQLLKIAQYHVDRLPPGQSS